LSSSAFHLNKCFYGHELVQANDLVTGGNIEAFFDYIRGDQNVHLATSEKHKGVFEFVFGHFDTTETREFVLE
jgi:hypothetical protein